MDAFEADEDDMFGLIFGQPLCLMGLLVGLVYVRSRNGKLGIALALLAGVWLCVRQHHF